MYGPDPGCFSRVGSGFAIHLYKVHRLENLAPYAQYKNWTQYIKHPELIASLHCACLRFNPTCKRGEEDEGGRNDPGNKIS